jgi:hypothetical protein
LWGTIRYQPKRARGDNDKRLRLHLRWPWGKPPVTRHH